MTRMRKIPTIPQKTRNAKNTKTARNAEIP